MTVSVPANAFTDAAGNSNTASGTFTIASDQTLPTVLISASDINGPILTTGYSRADTITFTFDLSEPAAQVAHSAAVAANAGDTFVLGDVTAPNCDNPLFTGTDRVYKLRCDASNDAVSVSVAAGGTTNKHLKRTKNSLRKTYRKACKTFRSATVRNP